MHPEPLSYLLSHTPRRARSELSIFSQDWWLELAREHPDFRELKVVRGGRASDAFPSSFPETALASLAVMIRTGRTWAARLSIAP